MGCRKGYVLAAALTLVSLVAIPAAAETPSAKPSAKAAQQGPAGFKRVRAEILRKTLKLDETRALAVEKIFESYAPERKKLRKLIEDQRRVLDDLLAKDSSDQSAYQRALDLLASHQVELNALRQAEQLELAKWLAPKQQAQLLEVMAKARRTKHGD